MHVDQAPEGGKFRAVAGSALDGTAGAWGDGDMLNVTVDSNGELVIGTDTDCVGVIWTPEGRRVSDDGTTYKEVIGGRKYTVLTNAELVEAEVGTSPTLGEGDPLWAQAAGDVDVTATPGVGAIWLGQVMKGGNRIIINVNLKAPSTA